MRWGRGLAVAGAIIVADIAGSLVIGLFSGLFCSPDVFALSVQALIYIFLMTLVPALAVMVPVFGALAWGRRFTPANALVTGLAVGLLLTGLTIVGAHSLPVYPARLAETFVRMSVVGVTDALAAWSVWRWLDRSRGLS